MSKDAAPFSFDGDPALAGSVDNLITEIPDGDPQKIEEARKVLEAQGVVIAPEGSTETPAANSTETPRASSVNVDSAGVPFDEKIHTGTKLKSGLWRTRKGATSSIGAAKVSAKIPGTSNAKTPQQIAEECRAAGLVAASLTFGIGTMIGGEEWKPDDQSEVDFMSKSWADYLQSKNVTDIPPGVALAVAMIAYGGKRFTRPKTQEKIGRVKRWIALRVARYKLRKLFGKDRVSIRDGVLLVDGKEHK